MRPIRLGLALALVVWMLAACVERAVAATLPNGWAPGGSATNPRSQIAADTMCASNSVLLFSARGSGDSYGGDLKHNKIGAWAQGAGIEAIHEGWNVRDLQAIYPAPSVPSFLALARAAAAGARIGGGPGALAAVTVILEELPRRRLTLVAVGQS